MTSGHTTTLSELGGLVPSEQDCKEQHPLRLSEADAKKRFVPGCHQKRMIHRQPFVYQNRVLVPRGEYDIHARQRHN